MEKDILEMSWVDFNSEIMKLEKEELRILLEKESQKRKRKSFINRLKQRLAKISSNEIWSK